MFVEADLVESKLCLMENLFKVRKGKISRKGKKIHSQNKMVMQKIKKVHMNSLKLKKLKMSIF